MAKVEIEDRAFSEPRLKQAAARFRVSRAEILGYAAIIWRETQQIGVESATGAEILTWLDVDRYSKPKQAIKWLVAAEFLRSDLPTDKILSMTKFSDFEEISFKISGNSLAILRTKSRIEKAVKAAKSRYHSDEKCSKHATSRTQACQTYRQDNNIQENIYNPLNPPYENAGGNSKKKISDRSAATAVVTAAVGVLRKQAAENVDPLDSAEGKIAFAQLSNQPGFSAFKLKFPNWKQFADAWYFAASKKQTDQFEKKLASELRAVLKTDSLDRNEDGHQGDGLPPRIDSEVTE